MSPVRHQRLGPGVEPLLLGQLLGVRVVADVPLLQEVARRVLHVVAALPGGPAGNDHVVDLRHVELHGVVVDLGDARRCGGRLSGAPAGVDAVVPLHVFHHEHQVVDDERVAVGPPGAGAQLQGDGEAVGRHRVAGGDVGHDLQRLLVHGQQVDVEHLGGQLAAALVHEADRLRHPQRAAVPADAVRQHLLHHRIERDALLDRRQLARRDPCRQHRGLAERAAHRRTGPGGCAFRVAACRCQHRRHQQRTGRQPPPQHPDLAHVHPQDNMITSLPRPSTGRSYVDSSNSSMNDTRVPVLRVG